jgi:hypothetical protein
MVGPVFDPFVEHWPNQSVLSHIRIKMPQEDGNSNLAADPLIKASAHLIDSVAGTRPFSDSSLFLKIILCHAPPDAPQENPQTDQHARDCA